MTAAGRAAGNPPPQRPPPPVRPATGAMSVTDMETAVDARLALTKSDSLGRDLASLTLRVVQLETAAAARGESSGHRATIVVAVIGAVGSLLVGVVLWALNFAATTKTEAVDQSTRKVDQKIEAAQEPAAAAYMRGVREGADEALSRLKKEQEQQDLVVVPRNVLKGRPTDKRP